MDVKKAAVTTAKTVQQIWNTVMSIVILGLLVVLIWTVFIKQNKLDVMMEDVNFPSYSQQSIKEVLNQFDPEGSWSFSAKNKKAMRKAGSGTAVWEGHVDVVENSGPSMEAPFILEISFQFNDDDSYQYGISKLQIYGYAWEGEELSTNFQVGQIMALIYGERTEMSFPAYDKFGNYVDIYVARPGTYSGQFPAEIPNGDVSADSDSGFSNGADIKLSGLLAAERLSGSWQDDENMGYYLFVGARDNQLYATLYLDDKYEFELSSEDTESASGVIMGEGTEPEYALDLVRDLLRINAGFYVGETGDYHTMLFVTADMKNCPYENPYL